MEQAQPYHITLQKKLIAEFKEKFYEKLGYYPEVITENSNLTGSCLIRRIPLDELLEIMDRRILKPLITSTPGTSWMTTIKNRSRIREVCEVRYTYFKIARLMGYSWKTIGRSVGLNHSTVIHGIQRMDGFLETDPNVRHEYYNRINQVKQIIDHEYRHLEHANQVQSEPESALSDALY